MSGEAGGPPRSGVGSLASVSTGEQFSVSAAVGGRRGLVESSLPGVVFVIVYTATRGALTPSVWAAVAAGVALVLARVVRRETLQHALSGFLGIAIAAFIAARTGRAENFYLPGLFINAGWAAAYAVSIAVRWPLLGLLVGPVTGEGTRWRADKRKLAAYTKASWVWVAMFLLRIVVQAPLYLAGAVVPLGVARLAMGWPLFGAACWLSYLIVRPAYAASRTGEPAA